MRRKWLMVWLAAFALVLLVVLLRVGLRNQFVVANAAGRPIRWMTIEVCDEQFRFENIPPGGVVPGGRFGTPTDESVFEVRGEFADGTPFHEYCGYVVWEDYGRRFRLTVPPDGMVSCLPDR